jgi:hypothetical protein
MSGTPSDNKNSVRIINIKNQINYRFFQVGTTVNRLRENLNEILALFNTWVQIAAEKKRFENTERSEEIQDRIQMN